MTDSRRLQAQLLSGASVRMALLLHAASNSKPVRGAPHVLAHGGGRRRLRRASSAHGCAPRRRPRPCLEALTAGASALPWRREPRASRIAGSSMSSEHSDDVRVHPCLCAMWCATLRPIHTPSATAPTVARPARWRAARRRGATTGRASRRQCAHSSSLSAARCRVTHPARRPRGRWPKLRLKCQLRYSRHLFGPVGEARAAHVADLRFNVVGQVSAPALALSSGGRRASTRGCASWRPTSAKWARQLGVRHRRLIDARRSVLAARAVPARAHLHPELGRGVVRRRRVCQVARRNEHARGVCLRAHGQRQRRLGLLRFLFRETIVVLVVQRRPSVELPRCPRWRYPLTASTSAPGAALPGLVGARVARHLAHGRALRRCPLLIACHCQRLPATRHWPLLPLHWFRHWKARGRVHADGNVARDLDKALAACHAQNFRSRRRARRRARPCHGRPPCCSTGRTANPLARWAGAPPCAFHEESKGHVS